LDVEAALGRDDEGARALVVIDVTRKEEHRLVEMDRVLRERVPELFGLLELVAQVAQFRDDLRGHARQRSLLLLLEHFALLLEAHAAIELRFGPADLAFEAILLLAHHVEDARDDELLLRAAVGGPGPRTDLALERDMTAPFGKWELMKRRRARGLG